MKLQVASLTDLSIVKDLAYQIWPIAYQDILSDEQLAFMLNRFYAIPALEEQFNKGHIFLLAEENNVFYGFASYEINALENKTKLHKIYVLSTSQGKGVGELLLKEVEKTALSAKNSHLFLNVNKYNRAQGFYIKNGFKIVKEEVIEIGQGFVMDDYVMDKEL